MINPKTRSQAIHLLQCAADVAIAPREDERAHGYRGCAFPVITATNHLDYKFGGNTWNLAWAARMEVAGGPKRMREFKINQLDVILNAYALLETGWEPS